MYEKEMDVERTKLSAFDFPSAELDGLHFIDRSGYVDWSKVVSADIKKIIEEKQCISLKENVLSIINYDLEAASSPNILDSDFLKLFRLAQLTVEYLLFVEKYYRKLLSRLNLKDRIMIQEEESTKEDYNEQFSDFHDLKNTSTKNSKAPKLHGMLLFDNDVSNIIQCSVCGKVFLREYYLKAHHRRRHTDLPYQTLPEMSSFNSSVLSNTEKNASSILQKENEKIWKELDVLRERVNDCELCYTEMKTKVTKEPMEQETVGKLQDNKYEKIEDKTVNEKPVEKGIAEEKIKERENVKAEVKHLSEFEVPHKLSNDGRLEAQERVWRGRLKALEDESTRKIEYLKGIIISYHEKDHALKEENKEKIEESTSYLKDKLSRQFEPDTVETVEPEVIFSTSAAEDLQSVSYSSDSVDTSAPSIQCDNEGLNEINSSFTYAADENNKTVASEVDSSDVSTSSVTSWMPENRDFCEEMDSKTLTCDMLNQKLKYLGIYPKTKKMPENIFREKLEAIHNQQRDIAKNIEGYYQIRLHIEEKALAKVSQRLQRQNSKNSRLQEFPASISEQTNASLPSLERKSFDSLEISPKTTSSPTTSRSSSNHHLRSRAKSSVIKSVEMIDTYTKARACVSVAELKVNKGMSSFTSYVQPKVQGKSVFSDSSTLGTIVPKEHQAPPSGSGILRGLPIQPSDGESGKTISVSHSMGNFGTKSVSFLLSNNLPPGKA